jgi:hypothetical protein
LVEADFQRFYTLDLRAEVFGTHTAQPTSARRLWVLVDGLPDDAATWAEDQLGWTKTDEWNALTIEAINHWGALSYSAIFALGSRGKWPKKLPMPQRIYTHPDRPDPEGEKPKKEVEKDPHAIARFFGLQPKGGDKG